MGVGRGVDSIIQPGIDPLNFEPLSYVPYLHIFSINSLKRIRRKLTHAHRRVGFRLSRARLWLFQQLRASLARLSCDHAYVDPIEHLTHPLIER